MIKYEQIPNGWSVASLKDLGSCRIGLTYKPEDVVQTPGKLVLRSSNIKGGFVAYSDNVYVSSQVPDRCIVEEGDILICVRNGSRGLIGKCAMIDNQAAGHAFGAFMSIYRSDDSSYIYQLFHTDEYKRQINENLGATINQITSKDLNRFRFLFPPKAERQKIAEILGACDEAIEAQERLIAQKQQRKKGLMQKLLTGEVRFQEFEGTADWPLVLLGKISQRLTEKAGERELDVLSITAGRGFVSQKEKFSKVIAGRNYTNYTVLHRGDFSYNKGNSGRFPQGCVYRLDEYEVGAVPNVFYSFRLDPEVTVCGFFVQLFKMGYQNKQLRAYINSGVRNDGLLNLNAKDFFKMKVPLPKVEEQQALSDFFGDQDEEITLQESKLDQLKQQKKGLMQQLLTGKVRVKV